MEGGGRGEGREGRGGGGGSSRERGRAGEGIILAANEQLYNFYQTQQPRGPLSRAVSPLNTVMIKRQLKRGGWWGGDSGGWGGAAGAVKRGHRGQEERKKGKSRRLYLPFPAPLPGYINNL